MNAIGILGFSVLLLIAEAMNDGFVYLSWTTKRTVTYGIIAHLAQLFAFFAFFMFGILYPFELFSIQSLIVLITYVALRFAFFDLCYNLITGNDVLGSTDVFDILIKRVPMLQNPLLRLIIAVLAIFFLINFI